MKKTILFVVSVMLIASFLVACGGTQSPSTGTQGSSAAPVKEAEKAKAEPITLKTVTFVAENHPTAANYLKFIKAVNEAAKGELVIKYVGGPEAIPSNELPQAVQRGTVDMAFTVASHYTGMIPEAEITVLSKSTPEEERKNGFYDIMVDLHKEKGIFYLGRGDFDGFENFYLYTNKPVTNPRELAGQKMRASPTYMPFMKALNITPVSVPLEDTYTSVESGLVHGTGIPMASYLSSRLYEVAKNVIDHGFYGQASSSLVNLEVWNKLPKHLQDLIVKVQMEQERQWPAISKDRLGKQKQKALDSGMKSIKFSDADAKWYLDTAYNVMWEAKQKDSRPEYFNKMKKALGQ